MSSHLPSCGSHEGLEIILQPRKALEQVIAVLGTGAFGVLQCDEQQQEYLLILYECFHGHYIFPC